MKEQRERLVSNAVEANLGKVEGTQSRFVDMGFVAPVTEEPTDYAEGFINAIKGGTEAIKGTAQYKTRVVEESADAQIEAEATWGSTFTELLAETDENGVPNTSAQQQIRVGQEYTKIKTKLGESGRSETYQQKFMETLSNSVKNDTVALFARDEKAVRENKITDLDTKLEANAMTGEQYRTAVGYEGVSNADASKQMLSAKTRRLKTITADYYNKNVDYKETITEMHYQKKSSGRYGNENKAIEKMMLDEDVNFEQAQEYVIKQDIFNETKAINPSYLMFQQVGKINDLHMKGDKNSRLISVLNTKEAADASAAINKAVEAQRMFKTINEFDSTKTSLKDAITAAEAGTIDGKALSTAHKSILEQKAFAKTDAYMANLMQGKSTPEGLAAFNTTLALNSGNKEFQSRYTQVMQATITGLANNPDTNIKGTLNYLTQTLGNNRQENSNVWALMDGMPQWQTALLAVELGAGEDDLEFLIGSFNEDKYSDKGILQIQGLENKEKNELLARTNEILQEMPIMQGDYNRYQGVIANILLVKQRSGSVDFDEIKEKMQSAATHNVGKALPGFKSKEGFRLPNSFKKSIALSGQQPTLVATATFMKIEESNFDDLKAAFPSRTSVYYDADGNSQTRERLDWSKIETKWVQRSKGQFVLEVSSGDAKRTFKLSDDDIAGNIKEAQQRATVMTRSREWTKKKTTPIQENRAYDPVFDYLLPVNPNESKEDATEEAISSALSHDKRKSPVSEIIKWFTED